MPEDNKKSIEKKLEQIENQFNNDRITMIDKASNTISRLKDLPPPIKYFGSFLIANELTFLAGDPGSGKSILMVQFADYITKNHKEFLGQEMELYKYYLLYYDFELSDNQFVNRYRKCVFSDKFLRGTLNYQSAEKDQFTFEDIKRDIEESNARIIILDNITALTVKSTEEANVAMDIMKGLVKLSRSGYTVVVIAHIPKTIYGRTLNINSLAGSKALANFPDSIFFIARSRKGDGIRYLKRVKQRSCEDQEDVLVIQLKKSDDLGLHFEFVEYADESEHIYQGIYDTGERKEKLKKQALELREKGLSIRDIAKELKTNKSKIERLLKKSK